MLMIVEPSPPNQLFQSQSPITKIITKAPFSITFHSAYSDSYVALVSYVSVCWCLSIFYRVAQMVRLPCMATRSSNLLLDTLTGDDEMLTVADAFSSELPVSPPPTLI